MSAIITLMQLDGSLTINTALARVWAALNDPEQLAPCVPGLESMEVVTPGEMVRGIVTVTPGERQPVRLPVVVYWQNMVPEVSGGLQARTALGGQIIVIDSEMRLAALPAGTTQLDWSAVISLPEATPNLERLLIGMIGGFSRKAVTHFFDCLQARLGRK